LTLDSKGNSTRFTVFHLSIFNCVLSVCCPLSTVCLLPLEIVLFVVHWWMFVVHCWLFCHWTTYKAVNNGQHTRQSTIDNIQDKQSTLNNIQESTMDNTSVDCLVCFLLLTVLYVVYCWLSCILSILYCLVCCLLLTVLYAVHFYFLVCCPLLTLVCCPLLTVLHVVHCLLLRPSTMDNIQDSQQWTTYKTVNNRQHTRQSIVDCLICWSLFALCLYVICSFCYVCPISTVLYVVHYRLSCMLSIVDCLQTFYLLLDWYCI
jgi:hypothetical protein